MNGYEQIADAARREIERLTLDLSIRDTQRESLLQNLREVERERDAAQGRLSALDEYVEEERAGASLPSDPVDAVREISEGRKGQYERLQVRVVELEGLLKRCVWHVERTWRESDPTSDGRKSWTALLADIQRALDWSQGEGGTHGK
jgi:chromosome segregation ATPase